VLEFVENNLMSDLLKSFKRILKEMIDPEKTVKHFKYFKEIIFFLQVMRKLSRMQKIF
jgi:hypothetical protein